MNIADSLQSHSATRGDHVAVEHEDERVTYAELLARVDRAVANLREAGIGLGDLVGVMLRDSSDHVVVLYALAKLGAVSMSVLPELPRHETAKQFRDLDVRLTITESGVPPLPGHRGLAIAAACAPRAGSDASASAQNVSFDENQVLMLSQSSGTTGTPKRLFATHAQMMARSLRQIKIMDLTAADRYLLGPSLVYMSGSRRCFARLHVGGTVVIRAKKGRRVAEALVSFGEQNITYYFVAPVHLKGLLDAVREIGADKGEPLYPNLKLVVSSGPSHPEERQLARQKLTPRMVESYGTNEVGDLTVAQPADHDRYPDSVGRLIDGVEAQVVDDTGRPLMPGEVGLIGFRAPDFPSAYIGDAEATVKGFRDGWFYPGDLAALNEEDYVFLKGRADDVINFGGDKFYPIEVEHALQLHPAVTEAAVVGRHFNDNTQVAVAFVVLSTDLAIKELENHCKGLLDSRKIPRHFETVERIPRTPNGKVLKRKLKRDFQRKYRLSRAEAGWAEGMPPLAPGRGSRLHFSEFTVGESESD